MSNWKPIETAPKDGTIIRLYIPDRPELEGMTGKWDSLQGEWCPAPQRLTLGREIDVPDPTLWMPLPKAPG